MADLGIKRSEGIGGMYQQWAAGKFEDGSGEFVLSHGAGLGNPMIYFEVDGARYEMHVSAIVDAFLAHHESVKHLSEQSGVDIDRADLDAQERTE